MPQIRRALRFEILRRDNFTCTYCGAKAPDVELQVDHVVPEALGGSSDASNLTTACRDCNAGKGTRGLDEKKVEAVRARELEWQDAVDSAREERNEDRMYVRAIGEWFARDVWPGHMRDKLPDNMPQIIVSYLRQGLIVDDIEYCAAVALRSGAWNKFAYFCGCCRNEVRSSQERAWRQLQEVENA